MFKVTIDKNAQAGKPPKKEIGKISNRLVDAFELSTETLSKYLVAPYSYTWCPATFNGRRSNKNFTSSQLIALDFDSGITPEEVTSKLAEYSIKPNIIYSTFSDSPELRKFRVIIVLPEPLTDSKEYKTVLVSFINFFKDSIDRACKDLARMFYGGKELIHFDAQLNDFQNIIDFSNTITIANDNGKTRKIQKMAQNQLSYINTIEKGVLRQKMDNNFNFDLAISKCAVLSAFVAGSKLISHKEIFGIATNLIWVEGGIKWMKDNMIRTNKKRLTDYTDNNFAALTYVNYKKYAPSRLENFSPFEADKEHLNILTCYKRKMGQIDILEEVKKITLTEAETKFKTDFDLAINEEIGINYSLKAIDGALEDFKARNDNDYLFKVPTGLGKTKMLEILEGSYILAFPTNALKNEVAKRMKHTNFKVTPDHPVFSNDKINDTIRLFHSSLLYAEASKLISKVANNKVVIEKERLVVTDDDIELANAYKLGNMELRDFDGLILTTHTRALSDTKLHKNRTIIFDEDPLNTVVNIGTVSTDFSMFDNITNKEVSEFVRSTVEPYFRDNLGVGIVKQMDLLSSKNMADFYLTCASLNRADLIQAVNSKYLLKEVSEVSGTTISYAAVNPFPANVRIIVLSATAPTAIYEKLIPGIAIKELTNIQNMGTITQYTKRGYSRNSISKLTPNGKDKLLEIIKDSKVITMQKHRQLFKNSIQELYFGNCTGSDAYKGEDLAIVGTPHLPHSTYLFYAKILGLDITNKDTIMDNQVVEWRNRRFKFMTFDNKDLRDIQLSLIESELIQAVGRARVLRTDAKVKLFSNLPLLSADCYIN